MLNKNDERTGFVIGVGSEGEGIVKEENCTVFLPFAILGEKIKYKVLKVKKNIAYGKVLEVIDKSIDRVEPKCSIFFKCGGCQLQHLTYSAQKEIKKQSVKNCFYKIGGIDFSDTVFVESEKVFAYRNKLQIPVSEVNGKTIIGFYAENSHRAVETDDCPISSWAKDIISIVGEYIKQFKIKGYNEETHTGELRHIVVRGIDGKFIITLVTLTKTLKGLDFLEELLAKKFPIHSLFINVNDKKTNVIFGDEFRLIYGQERYRAKMLGVTFEFGVQSFLQVNTEVSLKIYEKAVECATLDNNTVVIDAYSGAGLMTAMLASKAQKAYGVEIIGEAVECANTLAKINGLTEKMENICGKCEVVLPPLIKKLKSQGKKVTVVLDPPRKGCDIEVIKALLDCEIDKIVYVSCNPSTLARDIGLLTGSLQLIGNEIVKKGNFSPSDKTLKYALSTPILYDLFPNTKHIETLMVLTKN